MSEGRTLYGQSCHLDHQPGRTKDFTTFDAAAYDPNLKNIVCLFTVHMEGETEYHVAAGFAWVQHKIKSEFTSIDGETYFSPHGFVTNEGRGLLAGIRRMFPSTRQRLD